jgi:glycosyltransferase involved in cell wall biosynthesis
MTLNDMAFHSERKELLAVDEKGSQEKLRICFVIDNEFMPFEISHSSHFIAAERLANAGHSVSILSLPSCEFDQASIRKWQSYYSKKSIRWIPLHYQGPVVSSLLTAVHSYHILQWMLENASEFDIIHFSLIQGLAYYTLLAKHQGWAFQQIEFCVDVSFSTIWNRDIHKQRIDQIDDLVADFFEQECVRLADRIISQKVEVFHWMKRKGWILPKQMDIFSSEENGLSLHGKIGPKERNFFERRQQDDKPLVSLCMTHYNRPHYLAQALESIRAQDYSNFEVILIDDASTLPEAHAYLDSLSQEFDAKGWKIIRNKINVFPGAARNLAARQSRGEYLLFMDDDNYAKSHQITTFMQIARQTHADILTCAMDVFEGHDIPSEKTPLIHRFLPLGAAAGIGMYLNIFGDINALIKRNVYEALNGLTEDYGAGGEDWELFARAVLKGYHLEAIPLALFWYRDSPNSVTKTTRLNENCLRAIQSYLDAVPEALRGNLILAQTQQERLNQLIRDHHSLKALLKRCWKLFYSKAWRAIYHPRRSIKKLYKKLHARLDKRINIEEKY